MQDHILCSRWHQEAAVGRVCPCILGGGECDVHHIVGVLLIGGVVMHKMPRVKSRTVILHFIFVHLEHIFLLGLAKTVYLFCPVVRVSTRIEKKQAMCITSWT